MAVRHRLDPETRETLGPVGGDDHLRNRAPGRARRCGRRSARHRRRRMPCRGRPCATRSPPARMTPAVVASAEALDLMRRPWRAARRESTVDTDGVGMTRVPPHGSGRPQGTRSGGGLRRPRALRRGADRRRPVGRERHPAVPRTGRPVDEARRAADERLPALPRQPAQGLGGAPESRPVPCASCGTRCRRRGRIPATWRWSSSRTRACCARSSRRTSTTCTGSRAAAGCSRSTATPR